MRRGGFLTPEEARPWLVRMEVAMRKASDKVFENHPKTKPHLVDIDSRTRKSYFSVQNEAVEHVVHDFAEWRYKRSKLRKRPSWNEHVAWSRIMLWVAWFSWLITAKAERKEKPHRDVSNEFIQAIADSVASGQLIGKDGGRPEQ